MKPQMLVGMLVCAMWGGGLAAAQAGAQPASGAIIGTVRLTQAVMADGQLMAAGTYQVRLTDQLADPAVGQSADAERWVEFVRAGRVVGRELATVISSQDIGTIAKGSRPEVNHARVEELKGGTYTRVWINRGGSHYLINVPLATKK